MSRRFLNANEVADKVGMSRSSFDKKRATLEIDGFPRPALQKDLYGSEKWDEHAIEIWMDSKMDPNLIELRDSMSVVTTLDVATTLQDRANNLQL